MADASMTIRVTMMGPARVGKTTLLTAILENARALLAGTPVTIRPTDIPTEERLRKNDNELTADLLAGEFRAGSLSGTREVSRYCMSISPGVAGEGLQMEFLDFPGGLLIPSERNARPVEWGEIQSFLRVSTAMLIPVDAVVLMESKSLDEKRAVPDLLGLGDVRNVAEEWAINRKLNSDQPGTLIVSPVKCESYFTDNGNRGIGRMGTLFKRVQDIYGDVIDTVHSEAPNVQIIYAPVDSIGCVELVKPRWRPTLNQSLEPDPEFLVRPPGRRRVLGADDVLVPLVRQVVTAGRQSAEYVSQMAEREEERARRLAAMNFREAADQFGFWNELLSRVRGVTAQRQQLAMARSAEAQEALQRLAEYDATLDKIANRPQGPRVRAL
ncbi:MAG: hypothetical protein ACRDQ4_02125 [Pseudonocardiaceae bacterium]